MNTEYDGYDGYEGLATHRKPQRQWSSISSPRVAAQEVLVRKAPTIAYLMLHNDYFLRPRLDLRLPCVDLWCCCVVCEEAAAGAGAVGQLGD